MKIIKQLLVPLFTITFFTACPKEGADEKVVLAKLQNQVITQGDWDWFLNRLPVNQKMSAKDPEMKAHLFWDFVKKYQSKIEGQKNQELKFKNINFEANIQVEKELGRFVHTHLLIENLGYRDDELFTHYNKIKSTLSDSLNDLTFDELRPLLAEKKRFKESDLEQVFTRNKNRWQRKDSLATLEKYREEVLALAKQEFYGTYAREFKNELYGKHNVKKVELPKPTAQEYYKEHLSEYKTKRKVLLYLIEGRDSVKIENALLAESNDLMGFKKASEFTERNELRSEEGRLGWAKPTHSLPGGEGVLPKLDSFLRNGKVGETTKILRIKRDQIFGVFRIDSVIEPSVKPFERVKKSIELYLGKNDFDIPLPKETVLYTANGKPLITQNMVDLIRREIPPQRQKMFNRDRIAKMLLQWKMMALEAKSKEYNSFPAIKRILAYGDLKVWNTAYKVMVEEGRYGIDSTIIKEIQKSLQVSPKTAKKYSAGQLESAYHLIGADSYWVEFIRRNENYGNELDSATFLKNKTKIFEKIIMGELKGMWSQNQLQTFKKTDSQILDSSLVPSYLISIEKTLGVAKLRTDSLSSLAKLGILKEVDRRRLQMSIADLLLEAFELHGKKAKIETLTLSLGQIYQDLEKHHDAAWFYDRYSYLYPKSKDHHKALFLSGFLQSEFLGKEEKGIVFYEKLLELYPKSDFADDADFLIRDIKTGRKLSRDFLEKIKKAPIQKVKGQ